MSADFSTLSRRARGALAALSVTTVPQLAAIGERRLLSMPNCGYKTRAELRAFLEGLGYVWTMDGHPNALRGTCERMMTGNPGEVDADPPAPCGHPARFRFPTPSGGYVHLCTTHGEEYEMRRTLEVWTATGWTAANP